MSHIKPIRLAHELDAAWIIALWKAIHDGDPSPEQIAVEAIAALSETLTAQDRVAISESSFAELQTRLKEIGVELQCEKQTLDAVTPATGSGIIRTYCVLFRGQRVCIQIPNRFVWPHA